jgi:putative transposase
VLIRIYFYTGSLEYFQKAKWWKPDELRSSRPVLRGTEAEMPWSTHPYIKIKGVWHYLYRAVDKEGDTIDFMLSKKRDEAAATAFFEKAIGSSGLPEKVTIDKSGANNAGMNAINLQLIILYCLGLPFMPIIIRQIKYLNNIVEQDHRSIKRITNPMMDLKSFHSAEAALAGIELYHMLKKSQHVDGKNSTAFEQFYALAA